MRFLIIAVALLALVQAIHLEEDRKASPKTEHKTVKHHKTVVHHK